jgi:hypothetical protein
MRSTLLVLLVGMFVSGCTPLPPVSVVHVPKHAPRPSVDGDPVKVRRASTEAFSAVRPGAFVIRTPDDWKAIWKRGAEVPSFTADHDPAREMFFVVATDNEIVTELAVSRVVETTELVSVFVRQTVLGHGCVRRRDDLAPFDAVLTPRIEKPIKFYIEETDGPSCGDPPEVTVTCRLAAAPAWAQKLTAKAGDVVECELASVVRGTYELVDQMLTLTDLPPGSKAKLAFSKGPTRATIALDTFGTYAIRAEATDEGGRKGRATAFIDVVPKKTRDVILQLTWTDLDAGDPLNPPPRVLLRVAQEGPRGQRCSAEVPVPGLCDAKTRGSYTHMRIPASRRKLPVSLLYLEERPQLGPSPCVQVWFDGERTGSTCDRDHRHAEDRWEIGTLDTTTGKVAPPLPPKEPGKEGAKETPKPKAPPPASPLPPKK